MQASAKDLRFHTKEILESVSKGEEVIITMRGKPHAKLIPIVENVKDSKTTNPLRGIWKNNKNVKDVNKYVDDLRKNRPHDY